MKAAGTIIITLGCGNDLVLGGGFLTIQDKNNIIGLGPATKARISELQEYLERLKIHAE